MRQTPIIFTAIASFASCYPCIAYIAMVLINNFEGK